MLILLATLGMMMMISANDLIALYLGLELRVAAALRRRRHPPRRRCARPKPGLKYFVLGALSSGMLLYGASLIYGFTGTVELRRHRRRRPPAGASIGLIFGLVFLFAGLAFKISAVPFHMWTPDVYEGAPTPVTAFFAAAPKIAAHGHVRARRDRRLPRHRRRNGSRSSSSSPSPRWLLGAFAAIGQTQHQAADGLFLDRPHGLCAGRARRRHRRGRAGRAHLHGDLPGHDARHLRLHPVDAARRRHGRESIADLAGLARTHPAMAFVLAMLLFSLAGIPPLAGFFAKFYVFLAAIKAGLYGSP